MTFNVGDNVRIKPSQLHSHSNKMGVVVRIRDNSILKYVVAVVGITYQPVFGEDELEAVCEMQQPAVDYRQYFEDLLEDLEAVNDTLDSLALHKIVEAYRALGK